MFFGDSITAGHGVLEEQAFPVLLERALAHQGLSVRCINGGVSGDTSTAALARIDAYLDPPPALVVVELGANDALRGFDRSTTFDNLVTIVELFQEAGARVVLAGLRFPLAHPAHDLAMGRLYAKVADYTGVTLIPDLMVGVAGSGAMSLPDRIHPNASGHRAIAATALPVLVAELALTPSEAR